MSATTTDDYEFTCSQCGEGFTINGGMCAAVLERGYPICGGPVSADALDSCPA